MYHISAFIFILAWYATHTSSLLAFSSISPETFEVSGFCEGNVTEFLYSYRALKNTEEVRWEFGDPESNIENIAKGVRVTHRFSGSGVFVVNMIMFQNSLPIDTISRTVRINPQPNFYISSSKLCSQTPVSFELKDEFGDEQMINAYTWDFGDGSISHVKNPDHVFLSAGVLEISATITTEFGCEYTQQKRVKIAPHAPAVIEVENACEGSFRLRAKDTIALTYGTRGMSTDFVERLNWKLGENEIKNIKGETFIQDFHDLPAGEYLVNLQTTTNNGCVDEQRKWVQVLPKPSSPIGIIEDTVCIGEMAELQVVDAGVNLETLWFSNESSSKPVNFGTSYLTRHLSEDTEYWVQHENIQGCKSPKIPIRAHIFSAEKVELIASPLEVFLPDATVEIRTTSELPIKNWTWKMGDGNVIYGSENIYTYSETGEYLVKLEVESPLGCRSVLEEVIKVNKIAGISLPPAFTPNGDGKNDVLPIRLYDLAEWTLRIYDLNGKLMYESNDFDPVWDGKDLNNQLVKTGIYICVVEAIGNNGEKISENKRITLIR